MQYIFREIEELTTSYFDVERISKMQWQDICKSDLNEEECIDSLLHNNIFEIFPQNESLSSINICSMNALWSPIIIVVSHALYPFFYFYLFFH